MTLKIIRGQQNEIVLTLNELASNDHPKSQYLLRFQRDQGRTELFIWLEDVSTHVEAYNKFSFIEGADITFPDKGDYKYYAYQMPDFDDEDYTRGTLVEVGHVRVVNSSASSTPSFSATKNKNVFKNE